MNVIQYAKAICYSGYRDGQSPSKNIYPTYEQVKEDLLIIEKDFDYIRMYDASENTERTLEVIKHESIDLKVLITMDLRGEVSNPNCSWGGTYSKDEIAENIIYNQQQLQGTIELAANYTDYVLAVAAGNESAPDWNENLVKPERILHFVQELKKETNVPVTYCDNIHEWRDKLKEVAKAVDFISVHIYPVWEGKYVDESIDIFTDQYKEITKQYPKKQVLVTETGWPTKSNSDQIAPEVANEHNQLIFNEAIDKWTEKENVSCFFFEAFDELWKGSNNPNEPEKHWGYYKDNREPKLIKK